MKYYYLKDKRTNTTRSYAFYELDKALVHELEMQRQKLPMAITFQRKLEKAEHDREMAAGICPTCHQLRPLTGICPNCQ